MDCARVDGELVAFELAALDGATRAAVEMHLTGCSRCVSAYLALKRAIDAAEEATAPSQLVRARIRREAEAQLAREARPAQAVATQAAATTATTQPTATTQAAATTTKAVAPARGSRRATWAIVATAAAAALIAPLVYRATRATTPTHTLSAPDVPMPNVTPVTTNPTVDTARTTPENLAFL